MKRRGIKGLSIFYRLLSSFLGVLIVINGILIVIFYVFSKESSEKNTRENIAQQVEAINHQFRNDIEELTNNLRILASNPTLDEFMMSSEVDKEIHAKAVERLFVQNINYIGECQSIYFVNYLGMEKVKVDREGRVRKYRDLSRSKLFNEIKSDAPGSINIEGPFKTEQGKILFSIGISKNDADIGKFGGAVIIDYNLNSFIEHLDMIKVLGENHIWLFAPDGEVLKQPLERDAFLDPRSYFSREFSEVPKLMSLNEGMLIYNDLSVVKGKSFIKLAISIPSSLLLKDIRAILRFLFIVLLFSIFITVLIALGLSRYLSKPIIELAYATARLSKGEFYSQVSIKTTGEIGMLVDSFNRMAENLEKTTVSKNYVDNIINNMLDTLIVISPDGRIEAVNHALCALLGYEENEMIGQPIEMIIGDPDARNITAYDEASLSEYLKKNEMPYLTKDGRKIPMLFLGSVMRAVDGKIQGIVCVAHDITERKRREEEVRDFTQKLERSNKALEEFAYVASHDLQEPLRKVMSFGDRLSEKFGDKLDEHGRDYMARIQDATKRMQGLIDDLLTFSRVTTKAQPFTLVYLSTITSEVISDLEVKIAQTGGRVELGELPAIEADPLQMRQLIQNLIGNALKFHKKDEPPVVRVYGRIFKGQRLSDSPFGELCQITVEDNGIGFDEKYADRIFGLFQRLHGRSEYEGTGIGLTVCKKIVERHGGSITPQSSPGKGAIFIITLPVKQPKAANKDGGGINNLPGQSPAS